MEVRKCASENEAKSRKIMRFPFHRGGERLRSMLEYFETIASHVKTAIKIVRKIVRMYVREVSRSSRSQASLSSSSLSPSSSPLNQIESDF
ncbi:unnamed protein product [Dracunculus medinensis]|uniref:Uncharacterized protein n=1 Tax=Dracunculus medinensis TaxID=318479 RepID=A0A0N4U5D7_DRAME|nr:unnamed protein product [Dracunculus medinensis]